MARQKVQWRELKSEGGRRFKVVRSKVNRGGRISAGYDC
jgi:hypothetical protein